MRTTNVAMTVVAGFALACASTQTTGDSATRGVNNLTEAFRAVEMAPAPATAAPCHS
jgi:hypothetical protein